MVKQKIKTKESEQKEEKAKKIGMQVPSGVFHVFNPFLQIRSYQTFHWAQIYKQLDSGPSTGKWLNFDWISNINHIISLHRRKKIIPLYYHQTLEIYDVCLLLLSIIVGIRSVEQHEIFLSFCPLTKCFCFAYYMRCESHQSTPMQSLE